MPWNADTGEGTALIHTDKNLEEPTQPGGLQEGGSAETSPAETRVYKRRWYVLFVLCLLALADSISWNTWGPVSDSAMLVFGWSAADIGLMAIVGNIGYSVGVFGASYIMDVIGLRPAGLTMASLLFVAAVVRCFTSHEVVLFWTSILSAFVNGAAGTFTFSGSALISNVWFPPSQRTTSTAILNSMDFFGFTLSFILGPAFVKFKNPYENATFHNASSLLQLESNLSHFCRDHKELCHIDNAIIKQRDEIMVYLYSVAGLTAFLFLLVLVYFPSKPPKPPSVSASIPRVKFLKGLWMLTKSKSFWYMGLAYSIPGGLYGVWVAVLNVNLYPLGVSQAQVALIGLLFTFFGGLAGLIISRFSDMVTGYMKQILIVLQVLASISLLWALLLCQQYIPFNWPSMCAAAVLGSVFINGAMALFYELTSEICYPVAEGVICGYLTLLYNITGITFLGILYIKNIGTIWMNWLLFLGTVGVVPLLVLVKANYRRLQIDHGGQDPGH